MRQAEYFLVTPDGYCDGSGSHGNRTRSLAQTRELAAAQLERVGVTRIADVTALDVLDIPIFNSARPLAAPGINTIESGKGATREAAWTSAAMESIERAFGEPRGRPVTRASYLDMAETAHALDPRRLIPRQGHGWTPGAEVGWWPMREVLSGAEVMVPALGVFCPYEPEWGLWHSNTIGLASGNCPAEALLHGLYELIEHDATAFGEAFRLGYRVIPETMPEQAQALLERFSRAGIAVDVYTFTGDTGVPVFYVTSLDEHARDRMLINGGVGCSLDTTTALMRAINETAQSRLSVIAGAREDLDRQAYRRHASYEAMKEMLEQWGRTHTRVGFGEIPTHRTCCVRHTLDKVLAQIQGAGLDLVFASELAPADLPFSVVKAVVPGMEIHHEDRLRIGARLVRKAKELGPSPLFPESLRSLAGVV